MKWEGKIIKTVSNIVRLVQRHTPQSKKRSDLGTLHFAVPQEESFWARRGQVLDVHTKL